MQKLLSDPLIQKAISDYITSLATPKAPSLKISKKINNQGSKGYRMRASAMLSVTSPAMPLQNVMQSSGKPMSRSRHGSIKVPGQ